METETETGKKDKKYDGPRQNYTRFCNLGKECKRGIKCIWAHTLKQLNPIICKWDTSDEGCLRFEKCFFKHKNETLIQYVKRAFPEDLEKLNIFVNNVDPIVKQIENDENVEENDENTEENENTEEWIQEYMNFLQSYKDAYYDPAFEYYSWAEINQFDSDIDI